MEGPRPDQNYTSKAGLEHQILDVWLGKITHPQKTCFQASKLLKTGFIYLDLDLCIFDIHDEGKGSFWPKTPAYLNQGLV